MRNRNMIEIDGNALIKLHNGLFPDYPEDGGCPILDAIEIANINIDWFPKKDIVEEVYDNVDMVSRRICKRFESIFD